MTNLNEITTPQERDLLIAFTDITGYIRYCRNRSSQEIYETMSDYYHFVGSLIEQSGGTVVQFIGDGALIAYTDDQVDDGVLALVALKEQGDAWLANRHIHSRHIIKLHYGPVFCGLAGTPTTQSLVPFGSTVNTAAVLSSNGIAMTPQVFRKLTPATRKLFKKHTPPITYIPVDNPHV